MEEVIRKAVSPIKWESWLTLKRLTLQETQRTGEKVTTADIMEKALTVLDKKINKRRSKESEN